MADIDNGASQAVSEAAQQQQTTTDLFGGDNAFISYVPAAAQSKKFDLSEFRNVLPGLTETSADHRQKTEKVKSNEAVFSPQLLEGIKAPFTEHFGRLLELQKLEVTDPATGRAVKAYDLIRQESQMRGDPTLALEETMLTMITTDGNFDTAKMNDLMDDPRFIESAMRILIRRKRDIFRDLGMRAIILPEGDRGNLRAVGRTIDLPNGQAGINRAARDLVHWLGDPTKIADRDTDWTHGGVVGLGASAVATGAATGALVGSAVPGVGTLIGAGVGAGLGAATAGAAGLIQHATQNGLRMRFERSPEILQIAQENSSIRDEYLYGIDPKDFVMAGNGGRLEISPIRQNAGERIHTTNLTTALKEAIAIEGLQALYAEALHIDPHRIEDETQYIFNESGNWRNASTPQTGEKMMTDIHREYSTLLQTTAQETADENTRRAALRAASGWVPGAPYNPGEEPLEFVEDYELRNRIFTKAEATVIQRRLESILTEKRQSNETRRKDNLTAKKDSLTKGTEGYKKRIANLEKQKARAEGDQTLVDTDKATLTAYQTEVKSLTDKRTGLQNTLGSIGGGYPDVPAAITAINDVLGNPGSSITRIFDPEQQTYITIRSIPDQTSDNEGRKLREDTAAAALPRAAQPEAYRKAQEKYDNEKAKIDKEAALLSKLSSNLVKATEEITNGEKSIESSQTSAEGTQLLTDMATDWARVTGLGVTEAQLRTNTVADILTAINAAGGGWPQEENNIDARRQVVLRAVAEQKARDALLTNIYRARELPVFTDAQFIGLSEHQLRYMTPSDLLASYTSLAPDAVRRATDTYTVRLAEARAAGTAAITATRARTTAEGNVTTTRAAFRAALLAAGGLRTAPAVVAASTALLAARESLRIARAEEATANAARADTLRISREARANRDAVNAANARLVGPPPLTEADLQGAQQWSQEILKARVTEMDNQTRQIKGDADNFQIQIDASDARLAPSREQVDRTAEVLSGVDNGETQSRVTTALTTTDIRERLSDNTVVVAAQVGGPEGYTAAEVGRSRGELEFIQMLTGYMDSSDREGTFRRFAELFDPALNPANIQALFDAFTPFVPFDRAADPGDIARGIAPTAQFVWGGRTLTIPPPPGSPVGTPPTIISPAIPTTMRDLILLLQPVIRDRSINAHSMYNVMGALVNRFYQQAMAL